MLRELQYGMDQIIWPIEQNFLCQHFFAQRFSQKCAPFLPETIGKRWSQKNKLDESFLYLV